MSRGHPAAGLGRGELEETGTSREVRVGGLVAKFNVQGFLAPFLAAA